VSWLNESTLQDKITNLLLLLYIIGETNSIGSIENGLKLQKMAFISELKFVKRHWKVLNYNFFKWKKGPFSKGLAEDITKLKAVGLVESKETMELSKNGSEFLELTSEIFSTNKSFMHLIDNTIKTWADRDSESIMKWVYNQQVIVPKIGKPMYIQDIQMGQLILFKVSTKNAEKIFDLDESWKATLEVMFNKSVLKSLDDAYIDAIEGNAREFQIRTN
jgi:uncharacterized protein YwgA